MRSAVVGLKRRHSRSSTSGPDSRCVERSSASRSPRIESVSVQRLARHPPVRRERALQRAPSPAARGDAGSSARQSTRTALVGQVRDDDVVGDVDGGLLVGVALERLAQRRVQPPQRRGALAVRRRAARAIARSASAWLCSSSASSRTGRRLDVELQRLAGRRGARRAGRRRAPTCSRSASRHHQRVLRRHAQEAHERALARDEQALAVERLDRAQLARLRQRPARCRRLRRPTAAPARRPPALGPPRRRRSDRRSATHDVAGASARRRRRGSGAARASSATPRARELRDRELEPHRAVGERRPAARRRRSTTKIVTLRRQRRQVDRRTPPRRTPASSDLRPLAERERPRAAACASRCL